MSRIEELPDDFDESLDLNKPQQSATRPKATSDSASTTDQAEPASQPTSTNVPFPIKGPSKSHQDDTSVPDPTAALPPAMANIRAQSPTDILNSLNRTPLFMTTLDETDGAGGENIELAALRALAYEGTRAEVAANFKEQGNELAREKKWGDARTYYERALTALRGPRRPQEVVEEQSTEEKQLAAAMNQVSGKAEEQEKHIDVLDDFDDAAETAKERALEESCLVNRALCNLQLRNYRACNLDCAAALRLNPANTKAYFRSASACLALDKTPEALDAATIGLSLEPRNASLTALKAKILARKAALEKLAAARREREELKAKEQRTLQAALSVRQIRTRRSAGSERGQEQSEGRTNASEVEDAAVALADPLDAASTMNFPVLFLYPTAAQTDFVKGVGEGESVGQHLAYMLPPPWDEERGEFAGGVEGVDCFVENVKGGLAKVGKRMVLLKVLSGGDVEVVDGVVRIIVVPKGKTEEWIGRWREKRKGGNQ